MLSSRSLAISGTGIRLLLADPAPVLVNLVMPLLLAGFLMPATKAQLRLAGLPEATGAEQVVPGMAVLFAFLSTMLVCTLFFREHAWGTWQRLRASQASSLDIVIGKVIPLYLVQLLQMAVLFGAGSLLFGYHPTGSLVALAVVVATFVATLVAFGVALVASFSTMDQVLVVGNLGGMVMAGLGGALAPAATLPGWAQAAAHATPAYWGLEAIRDITVDGAGLADVAPALLALVGFTLAFAAVVAWRFRPADAKVGTT
ncbi:MAG: ABC transporter permease [Dactylosporangium sp.]|nr:ABC transporter permease [Dactylosporangium sp.]NNJ60098.1 ABC transporter permease [Dactylosporangium sp.]